MFTAKEVMVRGFVSEQAMNDIVKALEFENLPVRTAIAGHSHQLGGLIQSEIVLSDEIILADIKRAVYRVAPPGTYLQVRWYKFVHQRSTKPKK